MTSRTYCCKKLRRVLLYYIYFILRFTPAIISSYIKDDNNIDVISCECLNEYNGVKSFKVTLSFENRSKLLMSSVWPENIVVRKFYTSKTKK